MPSLPIRKSVPLWKRALVMVMAAALLLAVVAKPQPARADTGEALIYAGIGLGVYLAVIVTATLIIYRTATPDSSALPIESLEKPDPNALPIQAGTRCMQRDGQLTLFCW